MKKYPVQLSLEGSNANASSALSADFIPVMYDTSLVFIYEVTQWLFCSAEVQTHCTMIVCPYNNLITEIPSNTTTVLNYNPVAFLHIVPFWVEIGFWNLMMLVALTSP